MDRFDILILGCGQAAMPLAPKLANAGKRVAVVERQHLGGSCVNFGCTPSKAVYAPAHLALHTRRPDEIADTLTESVPNFEAVMRRGRRIVEETRYAVRERFDNVPENLTVLAGHGRLAGREGEAFRVDIDGKTVLADVVILETGTRTLRPGIEGLDALPADRLMTAGTWIERETTPGRLVMAGGGYIGLEGGQFYQALGSPTTIVEAKAQIAGHEDEDVAGELQRLLERDGVTFRLDTKVVAVAETDGALAVTLESAGERETIEADTLYLSPGRRPNTDDIGLDTVGLPVGRALDVDDLYRTGVENLYAVGDITGGKMFTHSAQYANKVLADLLIGDGKMRRPAEHLIPYAMFTDPPLGRCGLSERQAREQGHDIALTKFNMAGSNRHRQDGRCDGFIKLVGDKKTKKLLGAACLGEAGPDLVTHFQLCLWHGGDLALLTEPMFIHPTLSEATLSAARELEDVLAR